MKRILATIMALLPLVGVAQTRAIQKIEYACETGDGFTVEYERPATSEFFETARVHADGKDLVLQYDWQEMTEHTYRQSPYLMTVAYGPSDPKLNSWIMLMRQKPGTPGGDGDFDAIGDTCSPKKVAATPKPARKKK